MGPRQEQLCRAGVWRGEARRLARALAAVAKAQVFFREGAEGDLADVAWILCVGRTRALVDVRDGIAEPGPLLVPGVSVVETYLRVAFSSVARIAAMQEVTLSLMVEEGGGLTVTEAPRAGVFDPVLLKRVRKVVALLESS